MGSTIDRESRINDATETYNDWGDVFHPKDKVRFRGTTGENPVVTIIEIWVPAKGNANFKYNGTRCLLSNDKVAHPSTFKKCD